MEIDLFEYGILSQLSSAGLEHQPISPLQETDIRFHS